MAEAQLTIKLGGRSFSTGDLLAADLIAMEEEWGHRFQLIDFDSMKAACWVAWLVGRHDDPELTLEHITAVSMSALEEEADAAAAAVPPPSASRGRSGRSARSGGRSTPTTSESDPGSSSA